MDQEIPAGKTLKEIFGFDHVLFADDSNLLNSTILGLVHAIQNEALKYGLTLNFKKKTFQGRNSI